MNEIRGLDPAGRFERIESSLERLTEIEERLMGTVAAKLESLEEKIDSGLGTVKGEVEAIHKKFDALPLQSSDIDRIVKAKNVKIVSLLGGKDSEAYRDRVVRSKAYADIQQEIHRQFGVSNYKFIKSSSVEQVLALVEGYKLPKCLEDAVENMNRQMRLF